MNRLIARPEPFALMKRISLRTPKPCVVTFFRCRQPHRFAGVAGNEVCLTENPLPRWCISLAHTIEDGGIFMIGVGLAWLILGRNEREHFTRGHWGEF